MVEVCSFCYFGKQLAASTAQECRRRNRLGMGLSKRLHGNLPLQVGEALVVRALGVYDPTPP